MDHSSIPAVVVLIAIVLTIGLWLAVAILAFKLAI